ncbi:MAG: copper amine oxidase N-terminal domain-containing protein [Candidatus Cellulosilyticum pullistercoris]|uniref:Copper amine oxidase N-terminal domain-containing protein n=1 Tax=Candidatus Cellulosilyticum pullistercoris TaxID=2838521 RepID=A0A9E2KD12_9FIRM|nr:copper amine oxidase N-terminal domain-containing protein [Candidatus Cellulosilyticum pullistercoris]
MKLRQKLAMVLAAAMVVTSVPVVTMADTSNSLRNTVKVRDGSKMGFGTTGDVILNVGTDEQTTVTAYTINESKNAEYEKRYIPNLELYPKDDYDLGETVETFFVELEDGEFSYEAYLAAVQGLDGETFEKVTDLGGSKLYKDGDYIYDGDYDGAKPSVAIKGEKLVFKNAKGGTATMTITGSKQMRVDLKGEWVTSNKSQAATPIIVPLFVNAKGSQVKVKVDGADSFVSSGTYSVGYENEDGKELSVAVDDAKTAITVDGGEISKLILTEEVLSAIVDSKNRQIKLELPGSSDLAFSTRGIKATGKRGFYGKEADLIAEYGTSGRNNTTDKQILIITLPEWEDNTARGVIELTGIKVIPTGKVASEGDVNVTISANDDDDFIKEKDYVVGVVKEYGISMTCEKPATIKAGRSAIVNKYSAKFVLEENVKDSLVDDRAITFTLENGYIIGALDIVGATDDHISAKSDAYYNRAFNAVKQLLKDEKIKCKGDAKKYTLKSVEVNAKGQVIGFTLDDLEEVKVSDKDKLEITIPVAASLQATGEVKVVASGRALAEMGEEEELSCKVADIVSPITVDVEAAELKVGLQTQDTGKIVIKETDKDMFTKGTIVLYTGETYDIRFEKTPKVEATGIKVSDVTLSSNKKLLYIEVEKTSKEAGSISITDLAFTTDRTVPEGAFDLKLWGDALTDEAVKEYKDSLYDNYVVEDFIKITTPNTEDLKTGALKAVTSTFTIGSTTYTVDGVANTMDAPAYLKDNRTMVPVRYLAYAFGLDTSNVLYGNSTATIVAGEKIIQVTVGSDIMTVNGAQIKMDTKAELVNGRAYVPMKFIAAALGITASWDSASQTATFSNKN